MSIAEIMRAMIARADGNLHDIAHFVKVWAYARTIGGLEGLDEETQYLTEVSAIVHDIAVPFCRAKYGSTDGKLQEKESAPLVREFLTDCGCSEELISRVSLLVSNHHTYDPVLGIDHRILLEADYIVNAEENHFSRENVRNACMQFFRTEAGTGILKDMFGI
ncbi:MAG: HD domain-containing protein [Lachnospiraceae bacterium]|nr:HD domain-containing protein [Lachnospiraceae bacterium]